jgi:hypothetical protein
MPEPTENPLAAAPVTAQPLPSQPPTAAGALVPAARRAVGITKGPGEQVHQYTFISRDHDQLLKNGEYVYYEIALNQGASGDTAQSNPR